MEEKDIDKVHELGLKEDAFNVSPRTYFWSKGELRNWLKNKDDVLLVVEDKSEVIGFALSRFHKETKNVIIDNLFVLEDYRNKGIGTKLMKYLLKELKSKGAVYLCGMARKDDSMEFLKKYGFKEGYKFVWMEKEF